MRYYILQRVGWTLIFPFVTIHVPSWLFIYSMIVTSNYRHLNFHLTRCYITMHMPPCERKWLEKAMQDITVTWSVVVRPTLWQACDGEGHEFMPCFVIRDGVHVLHGDIFLKKTLASIASRCIGMVPPSNSSDTMCMVFLGADEWTTHWCIVSMLILQCVLVVMHINYQLHVQLRSEFLLVFTSVSVPNGLDRMHVNNYMQVATFPYMWSTTLLTMSASYQLLGWISNLYGRSFIRECMLCPPLFLFLLKLILLSV